MKKNINWIIFTLILAVLLFPVGHRLLTKVVFAHYCKNEIGLFIYEKIELDESYFELIENAKKRKNYNNTYDYNQLYTLDTDKFRSEYKYHYIKNEKYSDVGPIYSAVTSIKRVSDGKLLGKAVSGTAYVSLFKDLGSNMKEKIFCPNGKNKDRVPLYYINHANFLTKLIVRN